ncbi:hypothetical protein DVDV_3745 [Desulfovibrio sp. DV]|nr:hypothetical protein DVDV_3745 [Desulfovibrio sp. DV]
MACELHRPAPSQGRSARNLTGTGYQPCGQKPTPWAGILPTFRIVQRN